MADTLTLLKNQEDEIEKLKAKKSRLDGRREQLMTDLKTKFGVETLEAGEKLLEEKQNVLKGVEIDMSALVDEMAKITEVAKG